MDGITVGEVMQTDFITLNEADSLEMASQVFSESRHHGLAVVDGGGELGAIRGDPVSVIELEIEAG